MADIYLIHVKSGQRIDMPERALRVGRVSGNQLILKSTSVSRFHAQLERTSDSVFVRDLGSLNGTYVNGRRLDREEQVWLNDGEEVRFGYSTRFTVHGCCPPTKTHVGTEPLIKSEKPALPASTPLPGFGFEPNRVEFDPEEVGAAAAAKLRDRFRPIQVVSSGGMGKILLVQEVLSGRFVAMKVMLERAVSDQSLVQQFVREAVITARLQHPHIIPVHDLGFLDGNQLYYTMTYIEGSSFRRLMPEMDLTERLRVLRCAALAVDYAHSKNLWHRDLKPENILVGSLGDTYVIDWGLVSVQPKKEYKLNIPKLVVGNLDIVIPDDLLRKTDQALTAVSQNAMGTPMYIPPELISDFNRGGIAADVWAFGIMLFEALTGKHPLLLDGKRLSATDLLLRLWEMKTLPRVAEVVPDVPRELENLCARMLEKKPEDRLPSLAEFAQRIADYLRNEGVGVSSIGISLRKSNAANSDHSRLRTEVDRLTRRNEILEKIVQLGANDTAEREALMRQLQAL